MDFAVILFHFVAPFSAKRLFKTTLDSQDGTLPVKDIEEGK